MAESRTARRKQKKAKKKPIWKRIFLLLILFMVIVGVGVAGLFSYYIATAPEIDASKLTTLPSSKIYDKDGEIFADLGSEKRTQITYDDLPDVLVDAVIATEDARFFEHPGIDLRRIGGAVLANIQHGFGSEGASTITQQVVEKMFLQPDKKISLKVQEQWLALKLEREYRKEEILEMYLNKIYYGAGAYGVAKAAEVYFGKTDLHELTLPEAAILAGLPQRPSAYDPFQNPDLTKERMETVLKLMVRHEKITQTEADEALAVDIESLLVEKRPNSTTPYEAFIQQIDREVKEKLDGANIYTDGLEVYTTLDTSIQDHIEFVLTDSENNPIPYDNDEQQAGLVVLDTKTGAIRAIGGSRNNQGVNGYNYAIDGGNQPGSAFKPIVSYGPAIEFNKWSTYHQINDDQPFEIKGSDEVVPNWNGKYQGWMTARYALTESLNVPALKTLEEVGYQNSKEFANNLGIEFKDGNPKITDAVGGADTNVTPLQLAGAFRAFGNKGIYNEPYAVTKVVFPDNDREVEFKPEPEIAMSEYTAYMISDMLKTALAQGSSGGNARMPNLPVAAKTGTTNLENIEGANNSWLAGYTTNYTLSVWTGFHDNHKRTMSYQQSQIAHHLFKNVMMHVSDGIETPDFEKPDSVVEVAVEKGTNPPQLPSEFTPESEIVTELFVRGTEPTEISEKYDQLDPVDELQATYNDEEHTIDVQWEYESESDVSFEISTRVEDGNMQVLSTTNEQSISISELDTDVEYEIQIIVISNKDESNRSKPEVVNVYVPELENEEEDDNRDDREVEDPLLGSVEQLDATYIADNEVIDVTWEFNGPPVEYEIEIQPTGQRNIISSNGIELTEPQPGRTYTITVTPIGTRGRLEGERGISHTIEIEVPEQDD